MVACFTAAPGAVRGRLSSAVLTSVLWVIAPECSCLAALIPIMPDSFSLPLRPILEKNDRPDTLPVDIAQINNQWGSFRDVNEEVLRSKIVEEDALEGAPPEEGEDQEGSDVDSTERLEQLYKRRADITQFAMSVNPLSLAYLWDFEINSR